MCACVGVYARMLSVISNGDCNIMYSVVLYFSKRAKYIF